MIEYIWKINSQEAAYILNALAARPYQEVNGLIGKLHRVTAEQTAEYEKAKDGDSNKRE